MHDLRFIRENAEEFDALLARRGLPAASAEILALDAQRRAAQTEFQEMQTRRNTASKEIGAAKKKGEDAAELTAEVQGLKGKISAKEAEEREIAGRLTRILEDLPNLPASDVPDGEDEASNREERVVGEKPGFEVPPKEHFDLGEALGLMDFETAAKLSGARFVVLTGALARMERALANFMLDIHTGEFGYTEVVPPVLVRDAAMYGTGQLPKFAEDLFRTAKIDWDKVTERALDTVQQLRLGSKEQYTEEDFKLMQSQFIARDIENEMYQDILWLIPTAEVPLTGLVAGNVMNQNELPLRVVAWTPCFRAEAGAAGKDTRGMIRQHQFSKVEMVSVTLPDQSDDELERMTGCAEEVLKRLGLCYRVVTLCTGDMGFGARKTYDIEVWLPGQDRFREISSCSNCWDFQARRMNARYRPQGEKGTRFVHTLNGSGLAVGRTTIAIMENYQNPDGSIAVPDALQSYMGGLDRILPIKE